MKTTHKTNHQQAKRSFDSKPTQAARVFPVTSRIDGVIVN